MLVKYHENSDNSGLKIRGEGELGRVTTQTDWLEVGGGGVGSGGVVRTAS